MSIRPDNATHRIATALASRKTPLALAGCKATIDSFDYGHRAGFVFEHQQSRRGVAVSCDVIDLAADYDAHGPQRTADRVLEIAGQRMQWMLDNWKPEHGVVRWPTTTSLFDEQQAEPTIEPARVA